jgi:outer membrane murein-binding lipoprotein Lpp
MRRFVLAMVVLAACADGSGSRRWPNHRKGQDQQADVITDLQARIDRLEREVAALERAAGVSSAPGAPGS